MRAVVVAMAVLVSSATYAQVSGDLVFEVASVKLNTAGGRVGIAFTPGRVTAPSSTLESLIQTALALPPFRIVDAPKWMAEETFEIAAKAPDSTPPPSRADMRVMLRNLLADRFKLMTHSETRELPVYSLVLARTDGRFGTALRRSPTTDADCAAFAAMATQSSGPVDGPWCGMRGRAKTGSGVTVFVTTFSAMRMVDIANYLTSHVSRPVVDATGLDGRFDLELEFLPSFAIPPSSAQNNDSQASTVLFTALPEQAGLRLESRRVPLEVLVIDHVERPTPD